MAKTQFTHTTHSISPRRLLGALLALSVAFILLTSVASVAQKYFGIKRHIRELTAEQQTLEAKHGVLAKQNAYLATPEGTEYILREKYNVVKPGEGIVVIVNPEPVLPPERPSNVARWWHAIVDSLGLGKK